MNKIGMTAMASVNQAVAEAQEANRAEAAAEDMHALEDIVAARARAKMRRKSIRSRILAALHLGR